MAAVEGWVRSDLECVAKMHLRDTVVTAVFGVPWTSEEEKFFSRPGQRRGPGGVGHEGGVACGIQYILLYVLLPVGYSTVDGFRGVCVRESVCMGIDLG